MARSLALPKKKLPIIRKAIQIHQSAPQTDSADAGWTLGDVVTDDRTRSPQDSLLEEDVLNQVRGMLDSMDTRESEILRMRFGLDGAPAQTLKEIGGGIEPDT